MNAKRWTRSVVPTAVALGLMATACSAGSAPSGPTHDVLTVAASAAVTTWDPIRSFSTEALYLGNVYEPLLWKNPAGSDAEFTPGLAESWKTSADGMTWTFKIRSGATFHDGEPVNAAAVKASIDAAKDHAGASFIWAPLKKVDDARRQHRRHEARLPRADGSRRRVDLRRLDRLAEGAARPPPATRSTSRRASTPGTGPYTVADYTAGQRRSCSSRYDEYWNDEAAGTYKTSTSRSRPTRSPRSRC